MFDYTQPKTENTLFSGGCAKVFLVSLLLLVIAYGTLKYIHRPDYKPPFYARVSIDMKVMGRPTHIERIITCKTIPSRAGVSLSDLPRALFRHAPTEWVSWPRAYGDVLPDGSSIMIRTPYHCGREYYQGADGKRHLRAEQFGDKFLPFMAWSPDGVAVDTLELYVSDTYFQQPDARITNVRTHVELVDGDKVEPSRPDQFAWFSGLLHGEPTRQTKPFFFRTYYGWQLKYDDWHGKDAELDTLLATYDKPDRVWPRQYVIERVTEKLYGFLGLSPTAFVRHMKWRGLSSDRLGFGGPLASGVRSLEGWRQVIDFDIVGDAIRLDPPHTQGYLRFKRSFGTKRDNPTGDAERWGAVVARSTVLLNGRRIHEPISTFFYDPESQNIYWVLVAYLSGRALPSHPILKQSQH